MISKPATALPVWSQSNASSGAYGVGSSVFYQPNPDSAGYAYKAVSPYTETTQSPDENGNWEIDYSYANPWSPNGEYIIGARVYYFNGHKAYAYVASVRYSGGNGKPNEEVDLDGIRTWEMEMTYNIVNVTYNIPDPIYAGLTLDYQHKAPLRAEFLFPLRKYGGYTGVGKAVPLSPLNPEDHPDFAGPNSMFGQAADVEVRDAFLKSIGIVLDPEKADYSSINSVYQSYPYDSVAYKFYGPKLDANGKQIHQNKGIHAATYRKMNASATDRLGLAGKEQFAFVSTVNQGIDFDQPLYYNPHGFSIEMWPTTTDDDIEFVPSSSLVSNPSGVNPLLPWPIHKIGIDWGRTGLVSSYYGGMSFNGNIKDPDGNGGQETLDSELKREVFFYRTSPAFSERTAKLYFLKQDQSIQYKKVEILDSYVDNFTGEIVQTVIGYYYETVLDLITFSTVSEEVDSFEASYKNDNKLNFTKESYEQLNFKKYQRPLCYTGITKCGWRIE